MELLTESFIPERTTNYELPTLKERICFIFFYENERFVELQEIFATRYITGEPTPLRRN